MSFSVTGGVDRFFISTKWRTFFNSPPSFESPNDIDKDNSYRVEVTTADHRGGSVIQFVNIIVAPISTKTYYVSVNEMIIRFYGATVENDTKAADTLVPAKQ